MKEAHNVCNSKVFVESLTIAVDIVLENPYNTV